MKATTAVTAEEKKRDLRERTKEYALRMIRLHAALPKTTEAQVIGRQLLRSGTSVGAHYHEGQRAKSDPDLVSKLEGALQESEKPGYWLDLLSAAGIVGQEQLGPLCAETDELTAILVSVVLKVKGRKQ